MRQNHGGFVVILLGVEFGHGADSEAPGKSKAGLLYQRNPLQADGPPGQDSHYQPENH